MYCPHNVTLINIHHDTPYLTILRGVMLQALNGPSVQRKGDTEETKATLYVPFSVNAVNAGGHRVSFLPPQEYARCLDPENHWTLQTEGESAGRCSFFVKGELSVPCTLAEAREQYDFVFVVAGYQIHDYGSHSMQHYEVVSKVANRFYQYS